MKITGTGCQGDGSRVTQGRCVNRTVPLCRWGGDRILQYHPCNASHRGGAYFKISSGTTGTIRIDLKGNIIE